MSTARLSIVIPTCNRVDLLETCLDGLARVESPVPFELVVVDNGSTDDTVALVERYGRTVRFRVALVVNADNRGFARACNQGAALARGSALLFLNNDTVLDGDVLSAPYATLLADGVGIVGVQLRFADGLVQHAGIAFDACHRPVHVGRFFASTHVICRESRVVQAVTGACLFVRREVFDAVGGFDEGYVNGWEDIDLCFRVREAGWSVRYCAETSVVHLESQTAGRLDHAAVNRERFLARHAPRIDVDIGRLLQPGTVGGDLSAAASRCARPLRYAIHVGVPDRSHRDWGDVYYARSLSDALQRHGHACTVHYLDEWALPHHHVDVVVHLKGLSQYEPRPHHYNVLWMLNHPECATDEELESYDLVCVASPSYAEALRQRLRVPVVTLMQAGDRRHFTPGETRKDIDILFVGNNYGAAHGTGPRRAVANVLTTRFADRLHVYGSRWDSVLLAGQWRAPFVAWSDLPALYRRARVVLNDHQPTMRTHGFINNRTLDVAACGVAQICDDVPGVASLGIPTYRTMDELEEILARLLDDPDAAAGVARTSRQRTASWSFDDRAQRLGAAVARHMAPRPPITRSMRRGAAVPTFAVLMTTFNRPAWLARAIHSVVTQTFADWVLWVLNDGGDSVRDAIDCFDDERMVLVDLPHRGKAAALNEAIRRSRSRYITYLDDDDVYRPQHLEVLYEALTHGDGARVAHTAAEEVTFTRADGQWRPLNRRVAYARPVTAAQMLLQNHVPNLALAHERSLLDEVGSYDESLPVLIDWDLYRRLVAVSRPRYLHDVTTEYSRRAMTSTSGAGHLTALHVTDPAAYQRHRLTILAKPFCLTRVAPTRQRALWLCAEPGDVDRWVSALAPAVQWARRRDADVVLVLGGPVPFDAVEAIRFAESLGILVHWHESGLPVAVSALATMARWPDVLLADAGGAPLDDSAVTLFTPGRVVNTVAALAPAYGLVHVETVGAVWKAIPDHLLPDRPTRRILVTYTAPVEQVRFLLLVLRQQWPAAAIEVFGRAHERLTHLATRWHRYDADGTYERALVGADVLAGINGPDIDLTFVPTHDVSLASHANVTAILAASGVADVVAVSPVLDMCRHRLTSGLATGQPAQEIA